MLLKGQSFKKEVFMVSPVIFIHYGYAEYLEYSLKSVKLFNPKKRVILLGDKQNRDVAKRCKIEHYDFDSYDYGNEIEIFNKVFKFIAGKNEKNSYWINFVFRRWFLIYTFLLKENIDSFWTFDSDNLILTNLEKFENFYSQYDCTEQCNGKCLNGFIPTRKVVKNYVDKINELFQKEEYIKNQEEVMSKNPFWALLR